MKEKTSDKFLSLLTENQGDFISGADAAQKLGVSRTAVWKAVGALRDAGLEIDAVTNKGYRLSGQVDLVSVSGIRKHLLPDVHPAELQVADKVTSTNTLLKARAGEDAPDGSVLVALEQTSGRGRLGRSFFSPTGTGLYISVLLRPQLPAEKATMITAAAAVCVCKAIENVSPPHSPKIKWVNDIFMSGKKICGILTEAGYNLETGHLDYAVVGVGINVYEPCGGFPEEIKEIAGSIFKEKRTDIRNRVSAEFLNSFLRLCKNPELCIDDYRNRSFVLGKNVNVISPRGTREALAKGITDDAGLSVLYNDGTEEVLRSGEISVKIK